MNPGICNLFARMAWVLLIIGVQPAICWTQETPAQKLPTGFWPDGIAWNKDIPTPKEYFGFDIGQRHLRHDQVVAYLNVLAEKSERMTIETYGNTQGGRPLLLLTITSPANRGNLDKIRRDHLRLNNSAVSSNVEIETLPVVMNMGYSVHGDESSAGNVAPLVAYYLAAGEGEFIGQILDHCVILLDPCLNPDGFQRYSSWASEYQGIGTNADPAHIEHNQGWPPGRVNHYWFDLNRDWMPLTQLESQGRMKWFHQWKPDVVLDFHEMGSNSTFFFQPGEPKRKHPLTPAKNVELTGRFAEYHARMLDSIGSVYFTQEVFDDFYMGKGSTYPDLHGAVGILFEQGGTRGRAQETFNGLVTFADTIKNQFAASRSSLQAAVDLRLDLLENKRQFYSRSAELAAEQSVRTHVFTSPGNHSRLQAFADILLRHDFDCYWLKDDFAYGEETFQARDSLVVPADQADYLFLQSILEKRTSFEENVFYDVSAWTMPLAFGLKHHELSRIISEEQLQKARIGQKSPQKLAVSEKDIGYLIDWRDDRAAFWVNRLVEQEYLVKVAMHGLKVGSDDSTVALNRGTCLVALGQQTKSQPRLMTMLQRASADGVRIVPVATGLTPEGIDLGSNHFATVRRAQIAMFVGEGVGAYQAGEVWHCLDTRFGMTPTMIQQSQLGRISLNRYSVMIMPSGSYRALGESSLTKLKTWVGQGGTLICLGSATDFATQSILADSSKNRTTENNPEVKKELPLMRPFGSARDELALDSIAGAIFESDVDLTHPLFFGFPEGKISTFRDHERLLLRSPSPYANPAVYSESPLLAGYCTDENARKIAGTPSVVIRPIGSGRVILMTDNPVFRGFWRGSTGMLINAILFGDHCDPPAQGGDYDH